MTDPRRSNATQDATNAPQDLPRYRPDRGNGFLIKMISRDGWKIAPGLRQDASGSAKTPPDRSNSFSIPCWDATRSPGRTPTHPKSALSGLAPRLQDVPMTFQDHSETPQGTPKNCLCARNDKENSDDFYIDIIKIATHHLSFILPPYYPSQNQISPKKLNRQYVDL